MLAIIALFSLIPGVLSLLSALTMRWYRLNDDAMREINQHKTAAATQNVSGAGALKPQELS